MGRISSSILDSSLWGHPPAVRCVWVAMVGMADRIGHVKASIPGLARRANVTLAECEEALQLFLSEDLYSRSKEYGGRRIMVVDGGWALINYAKHSDDALPDDYGITRVNPKMGRKVPKDWQPNEGHKGRCIEFGMKLDEMAQGFREFEFNREYSDWDMRFNKWIMDQRNRRPEGGQWKKPPANDVNWRPNTKHGRYCDHFGLTLIDCAADWISKGNLERYPKKDFDEAFGRYLANLVRTKKEGSAA